MESRPSNFCERHRFRLQNERKDADWLADGIVPFVADLCSSVGRELEHCEFQTAKAVGSDLSGNIGEDLAGRGRVPTHAVDAAFSDLNACGRQLDQAAKEPSHRGIGAGESPEPLPLLVSFPI